MDDLGFFIVSHKLFDISRRNLILDTFIECSYGSIISFLIDIDEILDQIRNLGIFIFCLRICALFEIDEAEVQRGHTSVMCKSSCLYFSEICQIF
jgi:hypothetical protein